MIWIFNTESYSPYEMESVFEKLLSRIVLTEETRVELKRIEYLNEKVYDATIRPDVLRGYIADVIVSDLGSVDIRIDRDTASKMLLGSLDDGSVCSDYIGFRFSKRIGFPWDMDTVSTIHRRLTSNMEGYESGRVRNRPYISDDEPVDDSLQQYAESHLSEILGILNRSPYHPLIAASLFWNCLEILQPFQGDNRLVYRSMLLAALNSRNYRGAMRIELMRHLSDSEDSIRDARMLFLESGDPNPMVSVFIGAVSSAFDEAYSTLAPLDVKKTVDGLSRSIIRNSRRRESFVLSDTHSWLGNISDQTFRSRIAHLMEIGILRKIGNTKGTRYQYIDAFEDVRRISGGSLPHLDEDELQLLYLGVGTIARP